MIEDDRPGAGGMGDEDMDEPKKKKPRKIVEDDPSDLKDKLLKEENSVKLEIEWLIDSLGQYSYVSLPSTDSETADSHVWQILSIDEKLLRFLLSKILATRRVGTCNLSKSIAQTNCLKNRHAWMFSSQKTRAASIRQL